MCGHLAAMEMPTIFLHGQYLYSLLRVLSLLLHLAKKRQACPLSVLYRWRRLALPQSPQAIPEVSRPRNDREGSPSAFYDAEAPSLRCASLSNRPVSMYLVQARPSVTASRAFLRQSAVTLIDLLLDFLHLVPLRRRGP